MLSRISLIAVLIAASLGVARANDNDNLMKAIQQIGKQWGATLEAACPGPGWHGEADGLPNDPRSIRKCNEFVEHTTDCTAVSAQAGIYLQMVREGKYSFKILRKKIENHISSGLSGNFSLNLAREAPSLETPTTLVLENYANCMRGM
jgi:hypothetical protein